jgi:hypothetical protein
VKERKCEIEKACKPETVLRQRQGDETETECEIEKGCIA